MLEGRHPKGRSVLACGGPGSGKTILSIQFLVNGIKKYNEPGVFVTLVDSPSILKGDMKRFGWDL